MGKSTWIAVAIVIVVAVALAVWGVYSHFIGMNLWNGNVSGSDLTVYPVWCDNANASNLQNCTNPRAGDRIAYTVDKANSQVIFWDPDDAGFGLNKYENCTIVDLNNWSCSSDTYSFGVTSGTYYNNDLIKTIYTSKQQWDNINNGKPSPAGAPASEAMVASATIDQGSLSSTSDKPTITGTYSNVGDIEIIIASPAQTLPALLPPNADVSVFVFDDTADHGGGVNMSGNTYSDTLWKALLNGSYKVGIYQISTVYSSTGFQGYSAANLLTSGTLTVDAGS